MTLTYLKAKYSPELWALCLKNRIHVYWDVERIEFNKTYSGVIICVQPGDEARVKQLLSL